jgi:hypothetical protein
VRNVVSPIGPAGRAEACPQGSSGGRAGMGGRSKRRPHCNGADRGSHVALPRKGADFRLVLHHDNGAQGPNLRGILDNDTLWWHLRPAGRSGRVVQHRLERRPTPRPPTASPHREGAQSRQVAPRAVSATPARTLVGGQATGRQAGAQQSRKTYRRRGRNHSRHTGATVATSPSVEHEGLQAKTAQTDLHPQEKWKAPCARHSDASRPGRTGPGTAGPGPRVRNLGGPLLVWLSPGTLDTGRH